MVELRADGDAWEARHDGRFQHVASQFQHHLHPLAPDKTKRVPLNACRRKDRPSECKGGFPLINEITPEPLVVCQGIANARKLPITGDRSALGSILPARSDPMLNAAPQGLVCFIGDNADMKIPYRVPIMRETHEPSVCQQDCVGTTDVRTLAYQVQSIQALIAGYFAGYAAKMQLVGKTEARRMSEALDRHPPATGDGAEAKQFREAAKRLVRDLEMKRYISHGC